MKAISKVQVIDLIDKINKDGADNTQWSLQPVVRAVDADEFFHTCGDTGEVLQPGAYCALWVDDTECSNMPIVGKWIDKSLTDENIVILDNGSAGWIILICLDLF